VSTTSARYDGIADFYDSKTGASVTDVATAALLGLVGDVSGLRLLEVACGQGRIARELAARGAHVTGADISSALLAMAREHERGQPRGITYLQADVTTDLLPGERPFDGVVCNYGVTDIDDVHGLLTNVARLLRPGGWFVFSMLHPCFPGWDASAPASWHPDRGYYDEGWWLADNPGYRGKVGASHRMLSTYLNALADRGLLLDRMVEPHPGTEWIDRLPGGAAPVPFFLAARCRRR
jgi:SAM-dependent methyltransferase